ncbi:39S ribosomal protein L45, mitochondrial-like [Chenopodium quinoa]|uniref:39S ribosomal protein L45, mitochondrial-like n=1 Tax=Chenopodium quinoa TaxID=63459 RepID=UPI000B791A41|nr:39S ribosomal protein L45, mitochondrial-like [Chenopodium quinoa]
MALLRSNVIRNLSKLVHLQQHSFALGSSRTYANAIINGPQDNLCRTNSFLYKSQTYPLAHGRAGVLRSTMAAEMSVFLYEARSLSTQAKAPHQARQMGAMQVAMLSPGFIYEPYGPREPISILQRWFTRRGWRRTKEDMIIEMKSAYAISKLRKFGYSKQGFYKEAFELYKEINAFLAHGDKTSLRKLVTENMFSVLKNDIKMRETMWSSVYWELVEPAIKIRTLRARLIGVDRNDLKKVFIQLTLEFLTNQKFEAYNSEGAAVAGDKNKEVLVRDIWVFEKSLFHPGAYWCLCGRIPPPK